MVDETLNEHDSWEGPRNEGPGTRLGVYVLLRRLGEGGFGDVYEAEQEQPVRRRVALKIVKLGMDTREVIARFDVERQALAMMEHPHIARVLDAGATDGGRPYFVMELVDGEPITMYCDVQSLTVEARLRVFEQVCVAVQHAHTKGVIHRDLKPGNVLVSTHEGKPYAKVIDFGIAKATSGRLTERTVATRIDQVMGTPLYMSPEQARGSADIDTRTDIYSLGVILYELLTGSTPVERTALLSVSIADTQRLICETEPPLPSARLMKLATTLAAAANFRAIDPRRVARTVRGELDWIVMKALEKEPDRRYETANALAADIGRYLTGEPVLAAPPGALYRMGKFARRHKGTAAAAALFVLALLAGIAGSAWQARIARARAAELGQVAQFQAAMLGQVNPAQAGKLLSDDVHTRYEAALSKSDIPAAERPAEIAAFAKDWELVNTTDAARDLIDNTVLKPAAGAIDKQFKGQPLVAAYLRQTLAVRYLDMGLIDEALPLQESALETRRRVLGSDHPDTLKSMMDMGDVLREHGKLTESEAITREAMGRARRLLGEDDPVTLDLVSNMGTILTDQGRLGEAEPFEREALEIRRRVLGKEAPDTLTSLLNTGVTLQNEDKLKQAEPYMREAVRGMRKVLGENDPATLFATGNLGYLLELEGKLDEAEPYDRQILTKIRGALGEDNPTTLLGIKLLGGLLEKQGKYDEAVRLLAPAESATRNAYGGDNAFRVAQLLVALGSARAGLRDFAQAQTELLEADDLFARTHSATHARDLRECTRAIVDLYAGWNAAQPGKGYDLKALEWKNKLDAISPLPAASAKGAQ